MYKNPEFIGVSYIEMMDSTNYMYVTRPLQLQADESFWSTAGKEKPNSA